MRPNSSVDLNYEMPSAPVSRSDLATLALKMIGIYSLLQGVPLVQFAYYAVVQPWSSANAANLASMTITFSTYIVVGALLLWRADRLSLVVLRRSGAGLRGEQTDSREQCGFQPAAFSVLGAALVAIGVPQMAAVLAYVAHEGWWANWYAKIEMTKGAGEAAIGLILFVRAEWLTICWRRIRVR